MSLQELISSPTKSHLQTDSLIDKSDNTAHSGKFITSWTKTLNYYLFTIHTDKGFLIVSDNLQSNLGPAATEHSQVFEVCSLPISKRY